MAIMKRAALVILIIGGFISALVVESRIDGVLGHLLSIPLFLVCLFSIQTYSRIYGPASRQAQGLSLKARNINGYGIVGMILMTLGAYVGSEFYRGRPIFELDTINVAIAAGSVLSGLAIIANFGGGSNR
jgi:hypothetical protein